MAGAAGLEPATSRLTAGRIYQLSYTPKALEDVRINSVFELLGNSIPEFETHLIVSLAGA